MFIPPFDREDCAYQGVAGEGVAVDADGNVFAAEGPNSFVQAGGAFTKYSNVEVRGVGSLDPTNLRPVEAKKGGSQDPPPHVRQF